MTARAQWQVTVGRRLRWGPAWPGEDGIVLFDGASGDYWVLTRPTYTLLRDIEAGDLAAPAATDDPETTDLLAELQRHSLISPVD